MAKRRGAQYWQEQVEGWKRSGQTLTAYCGAHGLSAYTFRRWRQRLAEVAAPTQPLTLVAAKLDQGGGHSAVRLHSPGGWKIELPGAGAAWLAELLRRLP